MRCASAACATPTKYVACWTAAPARTTLGTRWTAHVPAGSATTCPASPTSDAASWRAASNATRTTQTAASAAAAQPQGMPPRHDAVRQVGRWRALLLRRRLPHRHLLLDPVPLEARWRGLQPGPARQVVLLPGSPGLLQHLGRHVRQAFLWRPVRGGSRLCRWPQMLNNYLPMVRRRQQGPARLCCRLGRCGWAAQARRSLAGWL